MRNKINNIFGLFPPIVTTLQAHGCRVADWIEHEGTLKIPPRSFVIDWPGDKKYGLGLIRTPSGAYVMWGQYPTGNMLHFAGMVPWQDDQVLVHEILRAKKSDTARWLTELIRLRVFRMMIDTKGGVKEMMCEMALRAQKRTLN